MGLVATWSYGQSVMTNSWAETDPPEAQWSYGQSSLIHDFDNYNTMWIEDVVADIIPEITVGISLDDTVWGHDTGVVETSAEDFSGNWTGTGTISGAGDAEFVFLEGGQYVELASPQFIGINRLGDFSVIISDTADIADTELGDLQVSPLSNNINIVDTQLSDISAIVSDIINTTDTQLGDLIVSPLSDTISIDPDYYGGYGIFLEDNVDISETYGIGYGITISDTFIITDIKTASEDEAEPELPVIGDHEQVLVDSLVDTKCSVTVTEDGEITVRSDQDEKQTTVRWDLYR